MNDSIRTTKCRVLKWSSIAVVPLMLLALFLAHRPWAMVYGLAVGVALGLLNFWELANTMQKAVTMTPQRAKAYAAFKYALRFLLTGIVVALTILSPYTEVLGTVGGLLLVKIVIYLLHLFGDKGYYRRIIGKEERRG